MRRTFFLAALLPLLGGLASCSKPKPPADPLANFAQSLKNSPKPDLQANDNLYNQLKVNSGSGGTSAAGAPSAPGAAIPSLASEDEFTGLIKASGFTPHPADPGTLPYFQAMSKADAAQVGLPEGLRMAYLLPESKMYLAFVAMIRPLRNNEGGDATQARSPGYLYAADLVAKLQKANPDPTFSRFRGTAVSYGMTGDTEIKRPMLTLEFLIENTNPTPEAVKAAINQAMLVLQNTRKIWE
jgi:hypothetical protein